MTSVLETTAVTPRTILEICWSDGVSIPFKVKKIANNSVETHLDQFPLGSVITVIAGTNEIDKWKIEETYIDDSKKIYVADSKSWQLIK